jgi:hypothetical protein
VEVFRAFYGPVHKAFLALDPSSGDGLERDLLDLLARFDRGGGAGLVVPGEYLEVASRGGDRRRHGVATSRRQSSSGRARGAAAPDQGSSDHGHHQGTNGDDQYPRELEGTAAADQIFGLAGRDVLIGFGGNDTWRAARRRRAVRQRRLRLRQLQELAGGRDGRPRAALRRRRRRRGRHLSGIEGRGSARPTATA